MNEVLMDEKVLQAIFERFGVDSFALRGEVREFSQMDPQSQLVWLFLEIKTKKNPIKGNVMNAVYTTLAVVTALAAWLAGGKPPIFGGD